MPESIDPTSDRPVYRQIADQLRQAIREGRYGEGDALPSETALAESYGVTRMTARQRWTCSRVRAWSEASTVEAYSFDPDPRSAVNTASVMVRGRRVVPNDLDIGSITRERRGSARCPRCGPRKKPELRGIPCAGSTTQAWYRRQRSSLGRPAGQRSWSDPRALAIRVGLCSVAA